VILENRSFNDTVRAGNLNPSQQDTIILCSCQFARKQELYLQQTPWDLVVIDEAQCRRFFDLPGEESQIAGLPANLKATLGEATARRRQELLDEIASKNGQWFDTEMDKLDRWAEDRRTALKVELEELDQEIKEMRKAARLAPNLPDKLERQRIAKT
jgi:hypothetical protein